MSETPSSNVQTSRPSRAGWFGAAVTLSIVLWILVGVIGLGVVYGGWHMAGMAGTIGLAVTSTVCAVQLGISYADRRIVAKEHAELLARVLAEIEPLSKRVTDIEWQLTERLSTDQLDHPHAPVLRLFQTVNGKRVD